MDVFKLRVIPYPRDYRITIQTDFRISRRWLNGSLIAILIGFGLLIPFPGRAETWSGVPHVVDGDTVYVSQVRVRLLSMDAFESAQNCIRDQREYRCGEEATRALITLIGQREIACTGDKRDRYNRPLVHCRIGDLDLGREMVRLGWALAAYGTEYRADQEQAQAARLGAWAGTFQNPQDWRRGHPRN